MIGFIDTIVEAHGTKFSPGFVPGEYTTNLDTIDKAFDAYANTFLNIDNVKVNT